MTQADRVLSTPPTNTPVDTTRRFETLKDAEDALMEQGFKLVPNTCNWIDADGMDAGVYPVEEAYGVSKYRIEYRALDATPTRRRFLASAAFASVAGAGSLAFAAAAPNDVPKAVTVPRHSRPEPAFVLIADKLAGDIAHGEAIDAQDEADERGIGIDEADDRCCAACDAVNAIDWKLATTPPTTLAGIAAVLRFANEIEDGGMEWPHTDTIGREGWHYQLRATMAAAIEALIKAERAMLS